MVDYSLGLELQLGKADENKITKTTKRQNNHRRYEIARDEQRIKYLF